MKINIAKLLSGGGFGLLHSAIPGAPQEALFGLEESNESGGKNNTTPQILSKEVLNELSKHGLPNDFEAFMNIYVQFQNRMLSGNVSNSQIAKVSSLANRIISNNNYFDKAFDICNQNNALDDFAIDQNGYIYSLNQKGGLEKVRFKDFNPSRYKALTYGELADLRRNSPSLINDTETILAIGSAISLEKINDFIQNILSKVKTTETKEETLQTLRGLLGQDIRGMSDQELNSLKALAEASDKIGLDSIFKTERFTKNSNTALALLYLMRILPRNMRAQLQGSYVAQGGSYKDSQQHASSVIQSAALMASENAFRTGISYDSSLNTAISGGNKKETQRNITPIEVLINGSLGNVDIPIVDTKDPNFSIILHGNGIGSIPGLNGHPIPKTVASLVLDEALGTFVDDNHITMGNQKISRSDLQSVIYNGSDIANVWAPVDNNGDIDINGFILLLQLLQEFSKHSEYTIQDKNLILQEYGIQGQVDENNEFHGTGNNVKKFLVFTGTTSDEVLDYKNGRLMDLVGKKDKDSEMQDIDRIYGSLNKGIKDKDSMFEFRKGIFTTDLIKAPIFLRLKDTAYNDASIFTKNGPKVTDPTYASAIARDAMRYQAKPVVVPSTGYIYNQ